MQRANKNTDSLKTGSPKEINVVYLYKAFIVPGVLAGVFAMQNGLTFVKKLFANVLLENVCYDKNFFFSCQHDP
jgi:hypothetical protein